MQEAEVECPFCGERFVIVVDPSVLSQTYVEDCEVCCRPIQLTIACDDEGELRSVDVDRGGL